MSNLRECPQDTRRDNYYHPESPGKVETYKCATLRREYGSSQRGVVTGAISILTGLSLIPIAEMNLTPELVCLALPLAFIGSALTGVSIAEYAEVGRQLVQRGHSPRGIFPFRGIADFPKLIEPVPVEPRHREILTIGNQSFDVRGRFRLSRLRRTKP